MQREEPAAMAIDAQTRIVHRDLCFGCGLGNAFGLQLELEPAKSGGLTGRFFLKQDHQGTSGSAHSGVIAAALEEAMALAVQRQARAVTVRLEVELLGSAPVGTYAYVTARVVRHEGCKRWASAELRREDGELVAEGRGTFDEPLGAS